MEASPVETVQVRLQSRPESVALVRAMLTGASEQLDFGPELLADLKTAVSEACNNVILHAYPDTLGPMTVCLRSDPDTVQATVTDIGQGLAHPGPAGEPPGLGFAVINALAAQARLHSDPGRGTDVHMVFARGPWPGPRSQRATSLPRATSPAQVNGAVVLSVFPVELLAGILGRIAGCLAAEAHFSIDRYSDLYLVTDGIAAHACAHASDARISAGLVARSRQIDLTVGPFKGGTTTQLQSACRRTPPMLLAVLIGQVALDPVTVLKPSG